MVSVLFGKRYWQGFHCRGYWQRMLGPFFFLIYINDLPDDILQFVKYLLMTLHFFQKEKIPAYLSDLNYDLETINQ